MAQVTNTFIAGKMNKSLDDRLIPKNQYKDGLNIRVDSSDASEAGRVENEKGNEQITSLGFSTTDNGFNALSSSARCIGSVADGQEETIYFFVTDNNLVIDSVAYKYDCIIAYNTANDIAKYIIEDIERISTVGQTTLTASQAAPSSSRLRNLSHSYSEHTASAASSFGSYIPINSEPVSA